MGLKLNITLFALCKLLFYVSIAAEDESVISLPDGLIRGKLTQSSVVNSNTTFYSFLGVRYAQPPAGKTRFLAPAELEPWNDTYDATYEKHKCYQVSVEHELQSEDCLFLNVFTPKLPDANFSSQLPVLFFIHGGGFIQGSGLVIEGYGPDFFMDYEVIFVSINYRLGPFGFFSTGDEVIPGNSGLKDQNMALKWVNKNIKYFGGDPNKVTIVGHSAGSASASYHLLSTKSAGLFQAAILESGSALSSWAYQRDQVNFTYATAALINSTYNITGIGSKDLLDYLLLTDGEAIHNASNQFAAGETPQNLQIQQGFYYAPVFEPEGDDAFITDSMYELYQSGKFNRVPVIIGTTAEESIYLYTYFPDDFPVTQRVFDENVKLSVPHDMHLSDNQTIVGQLIKDKYLGSNTSWTDNLAGSVGYFSDQCFSRSIIKQAELQSRYSDVYFYVFSYRGKMGLNDKTVPEGITNVGHAEELAYLFPRGTEDLNTANLTAFPEEDVTVHYRLLSFWTNFAKYLNPTPSTDDLINVVWPNVNISNGAKFHYLDIDQDLTVKLNPKGEKFEFWQKLYDEYAVPPYDTY